MYMESSVKTLIVVLLILVIVLVWSFIKWANHKSGKR